MKDNNKLHAQQVFLPSKFDSLEIVAVDLNDHGIALSYRIVVAYRPPEYSQDYNVMLWSALDYLAAGAGRIIILGDLNLPELNWELFLHPDNQLYNSAVDFALCNHGLTQLVTMPTRTDNILDVILCSDTLSCGNVDCLSPLGSSDHNIVSFSLTLSFPNSVDYPTPPFARPNVNRADWASISVYLNDIDWLHEFSCCSSAGEMWSKFTDIINAGITQYVPNYKSRHVSHSKIYYPPCIRRLYAKKLRSWKLYRTFRTPELLCQI